MPAPVRILIVHQYYLLPGAGGGSRFNALAQQFAAAGHSVTVVAGTLDYTTGKVPHALRRVWCKRQDHGPVQVWRCHVPASYGRSYAGRMWAFLGFTLAASTAAWRAAPADVVIATSPPLVAVLPAALAAWRSRAPWVFEVRDLWPESAVTTGVLRPRGLLTRGLYALEAWAARQAARVCVLTPAFAQDLLKRGLAPAHKIVCIPNGADLDAFAPGPRHNALRTELGWGTRTVALYAGAHGRANALQQLLHAAQALQHRPDILLACVGDGPERPSLQARAAAAGLHNIVFYGAQPKARMPALIQACDVGVAVLQNNPTFRTVYPNKVFDYLACARPVLLGIDGVARALVCDSAQAGVFAPPEDGAALAAQLIRLADDPDLRAAMGARGRAWVEAHASREALAAQYLDLLAQVATPAVAMPAVAQQAPA